MKITARAKSADSPLSRRQAIMGLAALFAAGSGLTTLRGAAARENEPGDDHGGHGNDDHGRRHRSHRHGRRHN